MYRKKEVGSSLKRKLYRSTRNYYTSSKANPLSPRNPHAQTFVFTSPSLLFQYITTFLTNGHFMSSLTVVHSYSFQLKLVFSLELSTVLLSSRLQGKAAGQCAYFPSSSFCCILDVKSADSMEAELIFWLALFTGMKTSSLEMNQTKHLWHYAMIQRVTLHLATRREAFLFLF